VADLPDVGLNAMTAHGSGGAEAEQLSPRQLFTQLWPAPTSDIARGIDAAQIFVRQQWMTRSSLYRVCKIFPNPLKQESE